MSLPRSSGDQEEDEGSQGVPHPIIAERKLEALRHALGATVLAGLEEPTVVEILANPDGRLILDRVGEGALRYRVRSVD